MKLKTIIEICVEPVIVYDKQGLITYVNPGFERVFGWKNQELAGKRIDFIPDDQKMITRKAIATVVAGNIVSGMETRRKTKHGDIIHVRLSAAGFSDENGDHEGMVVSVQDITDLVHSRQEALAVNQANNEFLSKVSHEVKTSMNHVMGMVELLLNSSLNDEQQEYVEILYKSSNFLMTVVNDMLYHSRVEVGLVCCDYIRFDLRTLVEEVENSMIHKLLNKELDFGLFIHQFVPSLLMGDPGRLRQVLVNLSSNLVKFMEKGGVKINILLEKEDDSTADICFEVIDTGDGIFPDQCRMIFDSFSQADGSAIWEYGGVGLGFSLSNKLVQMMGSTIEVSNLPGKGVRLFFTLSFGKQDQVIKQKMMVPPSFHGKKILMVDDNLADRRVLKTLSKDWDCFFDEADTPELALEKLKNGKDKKFDIILLNMELPGMGGEALAKKIRSFSWGMDLTIIVLASVGKRGDVERLREVGLNGYLPKPIKALELYGCIATALAVKGLGRDEMITRHILTENKKQYVKVLLAQVGRINRKIVLNILGKSGYRVNAEDDGVSPIEAFKTGRYNLILLDIDLSDSFVVIQTIRQYERENKKERVPILAMTENFLDKHSQEKYREYMDDFLIKPLTPAGLLEAIETLTWRSESFLRSHVGGCFRMESKKNLGIVFNFEAALERAMDDKNFLEMLVDEFTDSLFTKIDAMKEAVLDEDLKALILMAQTLKGSSGNMGADMIKVAAQAIETMGEKGDLSLADNRIKQLEKESGRFREYVKTIKWSDV
ncbi:MAG: response regulator [Desulfobacteraceae bacterium]|nr:response regulator [Desulfobacteraceae bacterium]